MDIGSLLIGLFFTIAFIAPIWLLTRAAKAKEKKLKALFDKRSSELNLEIAEQESWNEKMIGLDKVNKKVLFISARTAQPIETLIDLSQVTGCKINQKNETHKAPQERSRDWVTKVELQFTQEGGALTGTSIVFYDVNTDDPLQVIVHGEKAKKWKQVIEAYLKEIHKAKQVRA